VSFDYPQKSGPQIEMLKSAWEDEVPVCQRHLQVQALLIRPLGVDEGELIEVLELIGVHQLALNSGQTGAQLLDGITSERPFSGYFSSKRPISHPKMIMPSRNSLSVNSHCVLHPNFQAIMSVVTLLGSSCKSSSSRMVP